MTGAALVASVLILGSQVSHHIQGFETWIESLGPWAVVVFTLLYAVLGSVFVPDALLGVVAGASFGFSRGLAAVVAGSFLAACLQYALSRHLLKPTIEKFLRSKPTMVAVLAAVRRQELRLQLLIRLTPLNRALTSYLLGAAGVGFTRFAAACVALLPSLCLEVYFGYAGKHLARLTSQPGHTVLLHDVALFAGLAVAIAVMVVVSRTARKAVEAAAAPGPDQPLGA